MDKQQIRFEALKLALGKTSYPVTSDIISTAEAYAEFMLHGEKLRPEKGATPECMKD